MNRLYRLPAIVIVMFFAVLLTAGVGHAQPVIDRMTQQGVLTIGVRADAFPFTYLDTQGQPTGFSIDLVNLLKARLEDKLERSIQIKFAPVNTTDRYEVVKQGKIDLLCDSSSFSRSRAMDALYSTGYFQTGTQLLVRNDDNFGNQFRIGVIPGTTNADSVKRRLAFAEFVNLPNREAGLKALENNRIDALASDGILLEALRQASPNPDQLTVIPRNPYDEQTYACLIPPGNDRFQAAVNTTLTEFMQGVLDSNPEDLTLFDRWFGESGVVPIDREPVLAFFRRTISRDSAQTN
ncbi:amino acid ABC transporter substrate-binding protein [Leptolyngbya ohadii]|uniref:amino acid ABC transporter substrate-binding protein n=1 Tax=Leptolyngbya ohadii TaxID=1962290 RepID=UPI000B59B23C|nr:amino acid ABC transporter substrate-binding protein [Leptolyngbya ohadii]